MTLFDTEDETAAPAPDRATAEQVAELVRTGRSEKAVANWTSEHAATVIESDRREYRIVRSRARAKATAEERDLATDRQVPNVPTPPTAVVSQHQREQTVRYLEQALSASDPDELTHALMYCVWSLTTDELRRYAQSVVKNIKANPVVTS